MTMVKLNEVKWVGPTYSTVDYKITDKDYAITGYVIINTSTIEKIHSGKYASLVFTLNSSESIMVNETVEFIYDIISEHAT